MESDIRVFAVTVSVGVCGNPEKGDSVRPTGEVGGASRKRLS